MRLLISILFALWFCLCVFWWTCVHREACPSWGFSQSVVSNTADGLLIKDGDKTIVNIKDNFVFGKSSVKPQLSTSVQDGMATLATYLQSNPNRKLTVTGFYNNAEASDETKGNALGLQRAQFVKNILQQKGINPQQITTKAAANDAITLSNNSFTGGYGFNFSKVLPAVVLPAFVVKDEEQEVVNSQQNFVLNQSAVNADIGNEVNTNINKLATYLKSNPKKTLLINGFYSPDEKNGSMFDNLGIARADALRELISKLGVDKDRIKIGSKREPNIPFVNGKSEGGFEFGITGDDNTLMARLPAFTVTDGQDIIAESNEGIKFANSSADPVIGDNAALALSKLSEYIQPQQERELQVLGFYTSKEKNNTKFDNLGIARANAIKQELINEYGLSASKIITEAQLKDDLVFNNNITNEAIDCNILISKAKQEDLKLNTRPLYFATDNATLNVDDELRNYFKDIKTYMQQNAKTTVALTGHTDNEGGDAYNMTLGKKRANFVKDQLTRIGIEKTRISTTSKGESQPVARNNTPEGRQKNRRVEMIIKE